MNGGERIDRNSPVGRRWETVITAAQKYRLEDWNAMRLWRIEDGRLLSDKIEGPMIYVALGHQVCQYIGKSRRTIQERLTEHLLEEPKSRTWSHMGCIVLKPIVPVNEVANLERKAIDIMRPRMNGDKPRYREAG
jgi:hypothetical protein